MFNRSCVLFAVIGLPLCAAPLTNGSFETNTCGPLGSQFSGVFLTVLQPSTCITGWNVISGTTDAGFGSVDLINTYWQAKDGAYSIDLDGTGTTTPSDVPGGVSQSFTTTPGTEYIVTFALSGNPDGAPSANPVKTVLVSGPGATQTYTYNTATEMNTHTDMKYVTETFVFTATGASSTLMFQSEDAPTSNFGPVIDAVVAAPVPEPGTWLLTGAALAALMAFRFRTSPAGLC